MRIAWFTPVADGTVADYSRGVLAAMFRLCEPWLFCDAPPERFPPGIPVANVAAQPQVLSDLHSFDAVFYNLGNDLRQHSWIFDVARLHPGIVVLHDSSLHQFFLDYYVQHLVRPDLYVALMAQHYGIQGLTAAHRVLGPRLDPKVARLDDSDLLRYSFAEEALRSARGAVVHSQWHGEIVRQLWSGPVCAAWLPPQRPTASSVPGETRGGPSGGGPVTLMTLGPVEPRDHIVDVIELLAEDSELAFRTRYVIAGSYDRADAYASELQAMIERHGLDGRVQLLGQPIWPEVDRWARTADVFVNLRYPDDQARSMSLMYELPFGKAVIAYDVGAVAEVPADALAKVAIGDRSALHATLWELVDSASRREALGAAAKQFAMCHGTRAYARALLRFAAHEIGPPSADPLALEASRSMAEQIAADIGASFASLGVKSGSPGVDAVIREARTLLWPQPT